MRPAAPGSRIGSGRLRVDAARAIAKLREYQLAERTAWIGEAVRAAIASAAESVELDGDSNDVWLSWTGPAWDREILPDLLDELVSPEPSREGQHLRLLATAINSALGLAPAYVDLYAVDAEGAAVRVRYTPEVLELPYSDDDEPAIRRLAWEAVERPRRAPAAGMHLHLRRRAGLETLGHFLRGGAAPELAFALEMCRDLAAPIRVGAEELGRDRFAGDLLRAELGGSLAGFVAVLDPAWAIDVTAVAEIAERGVVITRYPLDIGLGGGRAPMPVRLFVDAPRMPTNASRSDVRRDAHPVKQAEQRARELAAPLIEQLAAELEDPATGEMRRVRLRDAALAMLAATAAGVDWPQHLRNLQTPLAALARLELVKNAVGRPMPVASRWAPSMVHDGREPLDEELEPWVSDILWAPPGDPAARLIERAGLEPAAYKRRVKQARRQLRRRRRFYRDEQRSPRIDLARGDWIHATIGAPLPDSSVADQLFEGVTGELAVSSRGAGPGQVTLLVDGRPLERVELLAPVRFSAILAHPRLRASMSYRSVERDGAYTRAVNAAAAAALRAIEAVAMAERGDLPPEGYKLNRRRPDDAESAARLFRGGLRLARRLSPGAITGPLLAARAWPIGGGEWRTTAELQLAPVIGVAPHGARVDLDRDIVRASPADRELLEELLGDTAIVAYDPREIPAAGDLGRTLAKEMAIGSVAALAIDEPGRRGAIAWGVRRSAIEVLHAGVPIAELGLEPELTDCVIAIDHDAIIPGRDWTEVTNPEILSGVASAWERTMAKEIARGLAGYAIDRLVIDRSLSLERGAGLALCDAIVKSSIEPGDLLGEVVAAELRARPLLSTPGRPELVSADDLAAEHEGAIPYVMLPASPVPGWAPLVVTSEVEARAVGRLVGRDIYPGADELARRQETAERDRKIAAHRRKPVPVSIDLPEETLEFTDRSVTGSVQISAIGDMEVQILIDERPFARLTESGLPIRARVEVPASWADETFTELGRGRARAVLAAVRARAIDLLPHNLELHPEALADNARVASLALALAAAGLLDGALRDELRATPVFPAVQGGRASIASAELVGLVRTASWGGEWLGPADGDEPDPLDAPVLAISGDADAPRDRLIDALASEAAIDETAGVTRLQVTRAMARGILPRPVVPGVVAEYKRDLEELGEAGRSLGAGEIALVGANPRVLVHQHGVMAGHIDVDVIPSVRLAVEDPALVSSIGRAIRSGVLAERVQRVTAAFVESLLAAGGELEPWANREIARAVLAGVVAPDRCGDLRLFETARGEPVPWQALVDQAARFGDVWYVSAPTALAPLDPERVVLRLDPVIAARAAPLVELIEASRELELDAEARANRDRPAVDALEIPAAAARQAIDIVTLEGDGITAPRGQVAVLAPNAAAHRRLRLRRELKPLGELDDPCDWPTVAVVDDRRLVPDRTWSEPERDEAFGEVARSVRKASERALGSLVRPPRDALASRAVWSFDLPRSMVVVRGRLWLSGTWDHGAIAVECAAGEIVVHPTAAGGESLPISGKLAVYSAGHYDLGAAVDRLARQRYGELVNAARLVDRDADLVAAHAAVALRAGLMSPGDLAGMSFSCFSPEPLGPDRLAAVLAIDAELPIVSEPGDGELSIVEDGSLLSQILVAMVGAEQTEPAAASPRSEPAAELELELDEPDHPLAGLARVIAARLEELGVHCLSLDRVAILPALRSLLSLEADTLYLGGSSDELAAIEAARQASSPWADAAIDAVVAHAAAELAAERYEITDSDQVRVLSAMLG
jgi:hypothetical protein